MAWSFGATEVRAPGKGPACSERPARDGGCVMGMGPVSAGEVLALTLQARCHLPYDARDGFRWLRHHCTTETRCSR